MSQFLAGTQPVTTAFSVPPVSSMIGGTLNGNLCTEKKSGRLWECGLNANAVWPVHWCKVAGAQLLRDSTAVWPVHLCSVIQASVQPDLHSSAIWPMHWCRVTCLMKQYNPYSSARWSMHIYIVWLAYSFSMNCTRHSIISLIALFNLCTGMRMTDNLVPCNTLTHALVQ